MMKKNISTIGVLTSGGDAPGMNAAIRSVVRTALAEGLEVYGIYDGYWGLYNNHIKNHIKKLDRYSVSDVINRGGTFLGSSRFPAFTKPAIRQQSIENLRACGIESLVVIGGDGSYQGAMALTEMGMPCIALPATIDNDVAGTDYAIGYFTALETVLRAIDQLRDTSSSHQRISIVEVMGRYCGDLTLAAAVAGGCEFIVIPEVTFDRHELVREIQAGITKGKKHAIITITENTCDTHALATYIEQQTGREIRTTVLGHTQRGGPPVGYDRILASRLGSYAVALLQQGIFGHCVGLQREQLVHHEIAQILEHVKRPFKSDWLAMAKKLF